MAEDESLTEVWRPINGYEGLYEVSNLGRVRGLDRLVGGRNGFKRKWKGKLALHRADKHGYIEAVLYRDGKSSFKKVHRLVAEAFIPNPDNKPEVDHIDTNKSNNKVDNLKWATTKENVNNPNTKKKWILSDGNKQHCKDMVKKSAEVCSKSVRCVETGEVFSSIAEATRKTGCCVQHCLHGRQKSSRGLHWEYIV